MESGEVQSSSDLFALHEDIRSVMVVDRRAQQIIHQQSRAQRNLPDEVQRRRVKLLLEIESGLQEQLEPYFGELRVMVMDFTQARVIRYQRGHMVAVITARPSLPSEIIGRLGALCEAWFTVLDRNMHAAQVDDSYRSHAGGYG